MYELRNCRIRRTAQIHCYDSSNYVTIKANKK
uniref:Uncharacterized protein n=1 Tax=Arundo donax TaxID=35708 RepID=A0A0A9ATV2_ARUDO